MPYKNPERKKEAARRWFAARGGYAAEIRTRRARMTPEQRESERERDRIRKRLKRTAPAEDGGNNRKGTDKSVTSP